MEYGLIGKALGHSYSVMIHRCFGDYDYQLYPMPEEELEKTLRERAFKGLNITIPYKKTVLPFCDELSHAVKQVGSANTLVMRGGKLLADNTDLAGMRFMLNKAGISLAGKKVIILGSGGTSLTAQAACRAENAREILVVSRSGPVDYEKMYGLHTDADVIINATPVGMYPDTLVSPVDLSAFPRLSGVADVIYNPARTALTLDARERGIPCADGLWMLAAQGWHAAKLFLNREIGEERLYDAWRQVKEQCLNLVLVGMPGSGKTALGKRVAMKLNKKFVDLDQEIEERFGPIPALFAKGGEEGFRAVEKETVRAFGKESGLVIATGGGAVLFPENVRALRQNGVIAWVRRPVEQLSTEGRPLSTGPEALKRMEKARTPLYRACADFSVENRSALEEGAARLQEGFHAYFGAERPEPEHAGHP